MTADETRQTATNYAIAWATRADQAATDYRYADHPHEPDSPLAHQLDRLANLGHEARETANMWANIARLLPAVLTDEQLHTTPSTNTDRHNAAQSTKIPGPRSHTDVPQSTQSTPVPARTGCCAAAVVRAAEQLLQHARTAPGMTGYERRCLEDAADFVRTHQPATSAPATDAPQQLAHPSEAVVLAARHLDPTEGVGRQGHCLSESDIAALRTVLRYVSSQHTAGGAS